MKQPTEEPIQEIGPEVFTSKRTIYRATFAKLEREQHSHVYNRKNNSFIQRFSGFLSFAGALSVCIQTLAFQSQIPFTRERVLSY